MYVIERRSKQRLVLTSDDNPKPYKPWKTNRQNRQQNTDAAYDSVTYNQVKTALSESQAEAEEYTKDNAQFRGLRLVGSSASASDNPVFTGS